MIALLQQAILRSAALLVPSAERAEWVAEWHSELWYARRTRGTAGATRFCLGAFRDALWFWRNASGCPIRDTVNLGSPARCLGFLMVLAALTLLVAYQIPGRLPTPEPSSDHLFVFIMVAACVIGLSTGTSLSLDYRANRRLPSRSTRLRPWVFLGAKIALILLMSYAPMRYLAYAVTAYPRSRSAGFVVWGVVWGLAVAFRWCLHDQRERCPVCLRLLGNPVRVGEPAGYFLEWNCTEFVCLRGHGMLYVPECHTSWFATPRWFYMDSY